MKHLKIEFVNFNNGATPESMAAYVLVSGLNKAQMKNKGNTALDVGNYIYREYGIQYKHPPEYHRTNEPKNSLAFYISKKNMEKMQHVKEWLLENYNHDVPADKQTKYWGSALYCLHRLTIQKKEETNERTAS